MDKRYPGFVTFQRHVVDGHGLQRMRKDDRTVIVAAGPDAPLLELLVNLPDEPFVTTDFVYEQGWYCAERVGDEWSFSLEGGQGQFTISHAALLRAFRVIGSLQRGEIPEEGEALDADEWDRRFDWAKESGLLTSLIEPLNELARGYVEGLRREGIVPGQSASETLIAARLAIIEALEREGVTGREQPDAIIYQLRDHAAEHLKVVVDALDMHYSFAQSLGGNEDKTKKYALALDWWILGPKYPSNGKIGTLDFVQICWRVFEQRRHDWDPEPIPFTFLDRQMYLVVGRALGKMELRGAIDEKTFIDIWTARLRAQFAQKEYKLEPPWDAGKLGAVNEVWHFPAVLRIFLERFGNGGLFDGLRYLSGAEILQENDLASWLRACPAEVQNARESIDWESETLPDGLLCISHYYYNQSRAYLLADGRIVWATPREVGYMLDPPGLWIWD